MFTIIVKCPKHPKYKAIMKPRANCERCRAMYECRKRVEMFAAEGTSWIPIICPRPATLATRSG
jgi:hypothetical protein